MKKNYLNCQPILFLSLVLLLNGCDDTKSSFDGENTDRETSLEIQYQALANQQFSGEISAGQITPTSIHAALKMLYGSHYAWLIEPNILPVSYYVSEGFDSSILFPEQQAFATESRTGQLDVMGAPDQNGTISCQVSGDKSYETLNFGDDTYRIKANFNQCIDIEGVSNNGSAEAILQPLKVFYDKAIPEEHSVFHSLKQFYLNTPAGTEFVQPVYSDITGYSYYLSSKSISQEESDDAGCIVWSSPIWGSDSKIYYNEVHSQYIFFKGIDAAQDVLVSKQAACEGKKISLSGFVATLSIGKINFELIDGESYSPWVKSIPVMPWSGRLKLSGANGASARLELEPRTVAVVLSPNKMIPSKTQLFLDQDGDGHYELASNEYTSLRALLEENPTGIIFNSN